MMLRISVTLLVLRKAFIYMEKNFLLRLKHVFYVYIVNEIRKVVKGQEHKYDKEWLRELGGTQIGEKEAQVGPSPFLQLPDRRVEPGGSQALLPGNKGQDRRK